MQKFIPKAVFGSQIYIGTHSRKNSSSLDGDKGCDEKGEFGEKAEGSNQKNITFERFSQNHSIKMTDLVRNSSPFSSFLLNHSIQRE